LSEFCSSADASSARRSSRRKPPNDAGKLDVEFGTRSLTFTGVTPGGTLIVFGVAREPLNTTPVTPAIVVRAETLSDPDRDGIVRLDLPGPVPHLGMWAAVDLASGTHMAFPTLGYEPRLIEVDERLLRLDNAGQLKKLEWPFAEIDVLLVRPAEGAWRFYASKSSVLDENRGQHHALRVDLGEMTPIGSTPDGPGKFRKGDIVAIFDRRELQYGILEVGR
jgi:hypothetical protein